MINHNLTASHFRSLFTLDYRVETTRLNYKIEKALSNGHGVDEMLDNACPAKPSEPCLKPKILQPPPQGIKKETKIPLQPKPIRMPSEIPGHIISKPAKRPHAPGMTKLAAAARGLLATIRKKPVLMPTIRRLMHGLPATNIKKRSTPVPVAATPKRAVTPPDRIDPVRLRADGFPQTPPAVPVRLKRIPRDDSLSFWPVSVQPMAGPKKPARTPPRLDSPPAGKTAPSISISPCLPAKQQTALPVDNSIDQRACAEIPKRKTVQSTQARIDEERMPPIVVATLKKKPVAMHMDEVPVLPDTFSFASTNMPRMHAQQDAGMENSAIKTHMQYAALSAARETQEYPQIDRWIAGAFYKKNIMRSNDEERVLKEFEKSCSDPTLHREIASGILYCCMAAIENSRAKRESIEIPAALLHLLAQYARLERNNDVSPPLMQPKTERKIASILAQAAHLDISAENIADPGRFLTSDELNHSCSTHPDSLPTFDLRGPGLVTNIQDLIDASLKKGGAIAMAPVYLKDHFMLLIAQHDARNAPCRMTIVSSSKCSIEAKALISCSGGPDDIAMIQGDHQSHVANACGTFVASIHQCIQENVATNQFKKTDQTRCRIALILESWDKQNPVHQQFSVLSTRAKMYANAVSATRNDNDRDGKLRKDRFIPCTALQWDAAQLPAVKKGIRTTSTRQHRISGRPLA